MADIEYTDEYDVELIDEEKDGNLEMRVMKKVTTPNPVRVDILPVGTKKYRVNVWTKSDQVTENACINVLKIVESFYHID